jgi:hypothetical protein
MALFRGERPARSARGRTRPRGAPDHLAGRRFRGSSWTSLPRRASRSPTYQSSRKSSWPRCEGCRSAT